MASNSLPRGNESLFVLAGAMADGSKVHESAIGVLHNTESKIRAALAAARTTASAALTASITARNRAAAQTIADREAREYIGACKRGLIHFLGNQYSAEWAAAGFPVNSLAVPKLVAGRQALVGALREYLAANPAYEIVPLGVTAARAAEIFDVLTDARAAANAADTAAAQAADAFETAKQALRTRMSGLITELGQLIGAEDPRWYAFGLSRPADPSRAGVPENLKISAAQPGFLFVSWSPGRRAARYRVYVKEAGETDFTSRLSTWELSATIKVFATAMMGGSVSVQVSAVNSAGESLRCEPVEFVVEQATLAGMAA